jgi:hypothetical protein
MMADDGLWVAIMHYEANFPPMSKSTTDMIKIMIGTAKPKRCQNILQHLSIMICGNVNSDLLSW